MPDKPCCAKCGTEYKIVKIGIGVLEHRGDGNIYRISAADLFECPKCGHQITWDTGRQFTIQPIQTRLSMRLSITRTILGSSRCTNAYL